MHLDNLDILNVIAVRNFKKGKVIHSELKSEIILFISQAKDEIFLYFLSGVSDI
ncbi:MAG: hypothetical protein QW364_01760 [Thermoplasmatales archaeon]